MERTTKVLTVDPESPDSEVLDRAAEAIREGKLVAFPTETVYGLGADALSSSAVEQIFRAKGRPATNPLIVHVADVEQARELSASWPAAAQRLADKFWPGPLTMVVRRSEIVSDTVCAGLETVALRMPAHPVARALIRRAERPVAAPSANRYTEVSPTTADHVLRGLDGRIDVVVDAGPTSVGLESTLVSVVDNPVEILRPGMIGRRVLAGVVDVEEASRVVVDETQTRPSPGMSKRHYSPAVSMRIVESAEFQRLRKRGEKTTGFIGFVEAFGDADEAVIAMPSTPRDYARRLYGVLHDLEERGVDEIVVEEPPDGDEWTAIRDRLRRAVG